MASILATVRDLDRLRQVVLVLGKHGFGEVVKRTGMGSLLPGGSSKDSKVSMAERLRLVLTELGPSAVKLGQILSTRPDLLPPDVIEELTKLQDAVPPLPFEQLRGQLEEALGAPIADVYEAIDEKPLAAASIGQVHRARLKTPKGVMDVVVKIQRPNIKDTIERDIDLMYWIARAIERSVTEAKIYQPVKLVAEFERAIAAELDYNQEADNAGRFERNFVGVPGVKFPKVYKEASSRKVLTLEFLPGMKINDAVASGFSGELIAKNAVSVTIKQIFEDGFFHADPHPGNVLILGQPDRPVLGIIDLGLVGRLTPQMRDKTIDLMVAVAREDPRGIADALYDLGRPTKKIDRNAYEAEVNALSDKYLGKPLGEIQLSAMIRDLTQGAVKYGIEIPADFLMVGKALMTIEGVGKQIYPELDVFEEVKPYFLKLFWQRYSPEKMSAELLRTANRLSGAANEIPIAFAEVLDDVRSGRLIVRTYEQSIADAYERVGRRIYSGVVVGSMLLGSAVCFANGQPIFGGAFFVGGIVWGMLHLGRLLILRRRK